MNHTDYGAHKPHLTVYAHSTQVASVYWRRGYLYASIYGINFYV